MLIAKFFAHSSQKEVVQLTALHCTIIKRIYVELIMMLPIRQGEPWEVKPRKPIERLMFCASASKLKQHTKQLASSAALGTRLSSLTSVQIDHPALRLSIGIVTLYF